MVFFCAPGNTFLRERVEDWTPVRPLLSPYLTTARAGWIERLGPRSRLETHLREPSTIHGLSVHQLHGSQESVTLTAGDVLRPSAGEADAREVDAPCHATIRPRGIVPLPRRANTCRRLVFKFDDGSTQVATFRFAK